MLDDELRPLDASNVDAQYTAEAYEFADPTKTECRRLRRTIVAGHLRKMRELPGKLDELLVLAESTQDFALARKILDFVKREFDTPERAMEDLERFSAVPHDAPRDCLCDGGHHHSLPPQLEAQLLTV